MADEVSLNQHEVNSDVEDNPSEEDDGMEEGEASDSDVEVNVLLFEEESKSNGSPKSGSLFHKDLKSKHQRQSPLNVSYLYYFNCRFVVGRLR